MRLGQIFVTFGMIDEFFPFESLAANFTLDDVLRTHVCVMFLEANEGTKFLLTEDT